MSAKHDYYAVTNVNGPISVFLDYCTEREASDLFQENDKREWIDEATTDIEDFRALAVYTTGMDADQFDDLLRDIGFHYAGPLDDRNWHLWAID